MVREYKYGNNPQKSIVKRSVKAVVIVEGALFAGACYVWYRMKNSQEFRYKMYTRYPSVVEGFHSIFDKCGQPEMRSSDYKAWGVGTGSESK